MECWLATGNTTVPQSAGDIREAVELIERCAARFAALHGETEEVVTHQAWMLVRTLGKATAAGRLFALRLWAKIWRRHRRSALQALPRFAITFVFGGAPLRLHRALRRRRAQRWRTSHQPMRQRPPE